MPGHLRLIRLNQGTCKQSGVLVTCLYQMVSKSLTRIIEFYKLNLLNDYGLKVHRLHIRTESPIRE